MSSASAIADALVAVLEAMSETTASKQQYVLDTATDRYIFIVRPGNAEMRHGYMQATTYMKDITLKAECYVKDLGDPDEYMNAQWTIIDRTETAIDSEDTLSSTCDHAYVSRWDVPEVEAQLGGMIFQPINFWVTCEVK